MSTATGAVPQEVTLALIQGMQQLRRLLPDGFRLLPANLPTKGGVIETQTPTPDGAGLVTYKIDASGNLRDSRDPQVIASVVMGDLRRAVDTLVSYHAYHYKVQGLRVELANLIKGVRLPQGWVLKPAADHEKLGWEILTGTPGLDGPIHYYLDWSGDIRDPWHRQPLANVRKDGVDQTVKKLVVHHMTTHGEQGAKRMATDKRAAEDGELMARYEEGKSMTLDEVTEPMSPEDAAKFKEEHAKNKDKFTGKKAGYSVTLDTMWVAFVGNKPFNIDTIKALTQYPAPMPWADDDGNVHENEASISRVLSTRYSGPLTFTQEKMGLVRETIVQLQIVEGTERQSFGAAMAVGKRFGLKVELLKAVREPQTRGKKAADELVARYEEGKKMTIDEVVKPMSPEDQAKFKEEHEKNKDKFKKAASEFKFRVHTGPTQVRDVARRLNRAGIKAQDGTEHVIGTIQAQDAMDAADQINAAAGFKLVEGRDIPSAFRRQAASSLAISDLDIDLVAMGGEPPIVAEGCPDNLSDAECKEWEANTEKYKDVVKDQHTAAGPRTFLIGLNHGKEPLVDGQYDPILFAMIVYKVLGQPYRQGLVSGTDRVLNLDGQKVTFAAALDKARQAHPELFRPAAGGHDQISLSLGSIYEQGMTASLHELAAAEFDLLHTSVEQSRQANAEIGRTILEQMGGARRLQVMLGVKQFVLSPNGVSFAWPNRERSKGNALKVTLDPDDTYTVEFLNASTAGSKVVKKLRGVYAEDLVSIFERQTGWHLRLAFNETLDAAYAQMDKYTDLGDDFLALDELALDEQVDETAELEALEEELTGCRQAAMAEKGPQATYDPGRVTETGYEPGAVVEDPEAVEDTEGSQVPDGGGNTKPRAASLEDKWGEPVQQKQAASAPRTVQGWLEFEHPFDGGPSKTAALDVWDTRAKGMSPAGKPLPKSKWDRLPLEQRPFDWATPGRNNDSSFPEPWRVAKADRALVWLRRMFPDHAGSMGIYTDLEGAGDFRGLLQIYVGIRDNRKAVEHAQALQAVFDSLKEGRWLVRPVVREGLLRGFYLLDDLKRNVLK